jgi:hypothetical protein
MAMWFWTLKPDSPNTSSDKGFIAVFVKFKRFLLGILLHIVKSKSFHRYRYMKRKQTQEKNFLPELLCIFLLLCSKSSAYTETHRCRNSKGAVLICKPDSSRNILSPFMLK